MKGVQWLHEIMRDPDSLDDSALHSLGCGALPNGALWLLELQSSNSLQADRGWTHREAWVLHSTSGNPWEEIIYIAATRGQGDSEEPVFLSGSQCGLLIEWFACKKHTHRWVVNTPWELAKPQQDIPSTLEKKRKDMVNTLVISVMDRISGFPEKVKWLNHHSSNRLCFSKIF